MTLTELKHEIAHWRLTKERLIFLSTGAAALLILEFMAAPYYRPFIYRNDIFDFHIADTLGNSLGTVAAVFIFAGLIARTHAQYIFMIKMVTVSVVVFELAHPLLGKRIDPWDILATVLSGVLCIGLYRLLRRVDKQSETRN